MPDSTEKLHPCSGNHDQMSTLIFQRLLIRLNQGHGAARYLQTCVFLSSKFPFHNVFFEVSFYLCFRLGPESLIKTEITSSSSIQNITSPVAVPCSFQGLPTTSKTWKQLICSSTDKQIKKNVLHKHNEILFSLKKELQYGMNIE